MLTRFPPEPNGYLHIGHAKSICLNFGIAQQYATRCNLRFDDTNPAKEDIEYVESIQHDVRWLGFDFGGRALYASDYFAEMYELAEDLVRAGKAYVDHLSDDEIKRVPGNAERARPALPLSRPHRRREPGPPAGDAGRRSPRRHLRAAGPDRPGGAEHEAARPAPLPDPPRPSRPHRRRLADLPHVRLRPPDLRRHRGHHPLRCAPWSSRTTARCTTGSSPRPACRNATGSAAPSRSSSPG